MGIAITVAVAVAVAVAVVITAILWWRRRTEKNRDLLSPYTRYRSPR